MTEAPTRLDIGAGAHRLEGFTPIDRSLGREAYPLADTADNSVEEIRASHILEHFDFRTVPKVLDEWFRVLKVGGRIRIAVPDADWCVKHQSDPQWGAYLMGGQTDDNDYHKSVFTESILRGLMKQAGFTDIKPWASDNGDCASLPCSLNLEGVKPNEPPKAKAKIQALMSLPRLGFNDHWGFTIEALKPWSIPIVRYTGVFWGQCLQRGMEEAIKKGVDWALTIDYDTMFVSQHLDRMISIMFERPDIHALCAMQARRGKPFPLMTKDGATEVTLRPCEPLQITTGHFGLTLIRLKDLQDVPKPWLWAKPDNAGEWGEDHLDDDIWFWKQWRDAGKTLYTAPDVRVGHLELMVSEFDDKYQHRHRYVSDWINGYIPGKQTGL